MADVFESVLEVTEYFDGPRTGLALYRGAPHMFKSRMLDTFEYSDDFESVDIFELTEVGATPGAVPLLANATFRVVGTEPVAALGGLRALEVSWHVIG